GKLRFELLGPGVQQSWEGGPANCDARAPGNPGIIFWDCPPNFEGQRLDPQWQGNLLRYQVMPALMCPSDSSSIADGHSAKSNYAMSMGNQLMPANPNPNASNWGPPCTLYPGNNFGTGRHGHGNTGMLLQGQMISGIIARHNWAANFRDITDGSANVICAGEIRPNCGDHTRNGWFHYNSMWVATTAPINYPIFCVRERSWDSVQPPTLLSGLQATNCNHWQNWQTSQGFKSKHDGGAFFLLCDGSVRFITESIDYMTYQRLGDRRDGEAVGEY
ncbi:MAG TPA: DUF1559 domain-containing protein, partial [Planctomycetaceae bacterium]|nr:DUF1559 domain-containing protein [Planctomycetaceae bacterium]